MMAINCLRAVVEDAVEQLGIDTECLVPEGKSV